VEVRLSVFLCRVLVSFFLPFLLLIACAQQKFYVNDIALQQKWMPFLEDGKTTKREIEQTLGQPTSQYEDGKIWAYSIELREARAGTIGISESYVGRYSVVLVFDEKNMLKRHSLLRFKP
jgi:hypothetical protein